MNVAETTLDVLISEAQIAARVQEMAKDIAADFTGKTPLIVPLLRGSFIFAADLVRALSREGVMPLIDFMTLSSYGAGTESSGTVKIAKDLAEPIDGHDVLIVDDILESGRTLEFARKILLERGAKSVTIAVLLHKPGKAVADINSDYVGFTIPDHFVVGYGLDWAGRYRELGFIGVVNN